MENTERIINNRKVFSRIGLGLTAMIVAAVVGQVLWNQVPEWIWGEDCALLESSAWMWLGTMIPMYVIAMPLGFLVLRKVPASPPARGKLGFGRYAVIIPIMFFFTYGGNLLGQGISYLISGGMAENVLDTFLTDTNPLKLIVLVILAPVMEELVFRKYLIDRTCFYGEKTAVLLSGLVFGLFHLNMYQFFYAFGVGVLFGYVYVRTGKIRNTILLHGLLNFIGGVIAPGILALLESDLFLAPQQYSPVIQLLLLPLMLLVLLLELGLLALSVAGLVMFIVRFKKAQWQEAPLQLSVGQVGKTVYWNVGMVLYCVICTALTVIALFP